MLSLVLTWAVLAASLTLSKPIHEPDVSPETLSLPVQAVRRQSSGSSTGKSPTNPIYEDWTVKISLGGQEITLLIDTGSSILWTLSDFMTPANRGQYRGNHFYNAGASPTWKLIPDLSLDAFYGDGSYGAEGLVGSENVSLGGLSTMMPIGAANKTVGHIVGSTYDGILGMGFMAPNQNGVVRQPTFMMSIQDQLAEPVFTLSLYANQVGSMNFGYVDKSLYTGSLTELSIHNKTSTAWWLDGVSFSAGGKNVSTAAVPMWFDTGAVATVIPTSAGGADAYWAQVPGATQSGSNWVFPCNTRTPDLTYHFPSHVPVTVPGATINNASAYTDSSGETCYGGIQTNTVASAGYAFFQTYFTVWNQAKPSLSFAKYA